ncbi:Protein of unknown function [Cotesia congregata]|uniref:Uncharacterized protein n=1 Tax=Cotesia congregata TaxID=51543 RepID=A0A8J2H7Q6_COTCN|nr:Protein of unknown function [Cotesia congregata]
MYFFRLLNEEIAALDKILLWELDKKRAVAYRIRPGCYQSIGPGSSPAYTNEYFQYLSVLFYSVQEIQTSSNLKSLPPTVVAHDLISRHLC